jgi:hypothetical protein
VVSYSFGIVNSGMAAGPPGSTSDGDVVTAVAPMRRRTVQRERMANPLLMALCFPAAPGAFHGK